MSRNISLEKRENLLAKIRELRVFLEGANATPTMKAYLSELESELKRQKFGLVFEEHKEEIDEILETHTPVLTEDKSLFIDNGGPMNFLIEGDNLAALTLLEKTHKGKIDLIYIDPPYNTGKNDFIYDDKYVNSDDLFKHSKWSSFMNKRLLIARTLLAEDGVLFIHIDDNEQSVLRLLCDEIFGANNFVGTIIQNKLNSKNDSADIQKNHDMIHVYRRMIKRNEYGKPTQLLSRVDWLEREVKKNEFGYYYLNDFITTRGEGGVLINRLNLGQTVYYNPNTGDFFPEHDYDSAKVLKSDDEQYVYTTIKNHIENGYIPIRPPKVRGKLGVWTWEKEKMIRDSYLLEVVPVRNRGYSIKSRSYVPSDQVTEKDGKFIYRGAFENNLKSIIDFSTNDGTVVLNNVMGTAGVFDNPKNLDMVMYILNRIKIKNPMVLDFFAGSGTTGHAVMELNKQDGGNRKFILCTNNENGICRDVTYERIKTVITGKRKDGTTYGEPLPASLKYQRIDFIPTSEQTYYDYADELLLHIRELVELENAINFEGNTNLAILLTEDEVEQFFVSEDKLNSVKTIYLGHDIALTLKQQQQVADNNITLNIIPEYYYKEQQI